MSISFIGGGNERTRTKPPTTDRELRGAHLTTSKWAIVVAIVYSLDLCPHIQSMHTSSKVVNYLPTDHLVCEHLTFWGFIPPIITVPHQENLFPRYNL